MKNLLVAATVALIANSVCAQDFELRKPDTIGIHLYTQHFSPSQGYNNYNPGMYVEYSNIVVGAYYNSERAGSVYGGYIFKQVFNTPIDVLVGVVTGYKDHPILPLITPSIRVFDHLRFSLIPNVDKTGWGMHVSLEF